MPLRLQSFRKKIRAMARERKEKGPFHRCFIGLGSNIEPRGKYIQRALDLLAEIPQIRIEKVSSLYETLPEGPLKSQDKFLNGVVEILTSLGPFQLLDVLQQIEDRLGRKREIFWGPRTIDLDILLYEDKIISTDRLVVPHPLMHVRRFVMLPLAEIAPDVVHPILMMTARTILLSLGEEL